MNDYDIVYFGNDWFGENKTSSHHIAEHFALKHRILYVECPGLRMPKGNTRDIKKIFKKIFIIFFDLIIAQRFNKKKNNKLN